MDSNLNGWEGDGGWSEGSVKQATRWRWGRGEGDGREEAFSILPVASESGGIECTTWLGLAATGLRGHWHAGCSARVGGDSALEPAPYVASL